MIQGRHRFAEGQQGSIPTANLRKGVSSGLPSHRLCGEGASSRNQGRARQGLAQTTRPSLPSILGASKQRPAKRLRCGCESLHPIYRVCRSLLPRCVLGRNLIASYLQRWSLTE